MTPEAALDWSLVIPLKVLAEAKSRLAVLPAGGRAELALAMAADTVAAATAAAAVRTVLVITDDAVVGAEMERLGALVLADEPAAGLNEALTFGADYAREQWPERGVAALAGDLPALRPEELTTALGAVAPGERAFVRDADGTGTTLYAAGPGTSFEPLFGVASASRHRGAGAEELAVPLSAGLRRDVDTADDLQRAAEIGLGPRTTALLATVREW
jgi:2-phospho-L-lactate/phosphoenolpyruvate guanylyltransferase